MNINPSEHPNTLKIDPANLPALIDIEGINRLLCPMSRTTAYQLASEGEIQTASLGLGRGRRVFVTSSIVDWLQRRIAQSKRPNLSPRRNHHKKEGQPK